MQANKPQKPQSEELRNPVSPQFIARLDTLNESMSRLSSSTKFDISYTTYCDYMRKFKEDLDLADAAWPEGEAEDIKYMTHEIFRVYFEIGVLWDKYHELREKTSFPAEYRNSFENGTKLVNLAQPAILRYLQEHPAK